MTTLTMAHKASSKADGGITLLGRVRAFLARSQAERQLSQLDDRLLADIGLKRSDIRKMVWGS
jgi:uncharacterized protein YjiS (DUF1127 family)